MVLTWTEYVMSEHDRPTDQTTEVYESASHRRPPRWTIGVVAVAILMAGLAGGLAIVQLAGGPPAMRVPVAPPSPTASPTPAVVVSVNAGATAAATAAATAVATIVQRPAPAPVAPQPPLRESGGNLNQAPTNSTKPQQPVAPPTTGPAPSPSPSPSKKCLLHKLLAICI